MRKIAAIADIHGCLDEFQDLYKKLQWLTLDEIWCLGDLVDRGPDSGGVLAMCREELIPSVLGNHDDSITGHYERFKRSGIKPQNRDKAITVSQMCDADYEYIKKMPPLHIFDDTGLVLVHGGIFPTVPLYKQPRNVIRAQLIHPHKFGESRWWGEDATKHRSGKSEEQSRSEGFVRWYEIYNHEQDVVYGHSVFNQPKIHRRKGYGTSVGVDNGSCFGGLLTAAIFDGSREDPVFLSVKCKKVYAAEASRVIQDE